MTIVADTNDLNDALEDMRDKSRVLNDSLRQLSVEGFDKLAQVIGRGGSRAQGRADPGNIVAQELSRLLRQETASMLQTIFCGAGPDILRQGRGGGNGAISVIINNNSSAQVTARETGDSFDQKYLEITIDQMVANSLLKGRQTSGVMRSLFGLAPNLLGR